MCLSSVRKENLYQIKYSLFQITLRLNSEDNCVFFIFHRYYKYIDIFLRPEAHEALKLMVKNSRSCPTTYGQELNQES